MPTTNSNFYSFQDCFRGQIICWEQALWGHGFAFANIKYSFCKIIAELKLELWMVGGPDCASELSSQQIQTMEKLSSLGNIHNPFKPKVGLRNSHPTQLCWNWKSNFAELICQRQQHMSKIINVTIKFYRSKYSTINFLLRSFTLWRCNSHDTRKFN